VMILDQPYSPAFRYSIIGSLSDPIWPIVRTQQFPELGDTRLLL
jgi:hypothetical protein